MTAHTSAGIADRSAAPTWMMTPAGAGTAGVAWPSFPQLRARVSRPHSDALVIMVDGDLDAATVDYLQLVLWPRLSATVDTLLVALTGVGFLGVSGLQLLSCAHLRAQTRGGWPSGWCWTVVKPNAPCAWPGSSRLCRALPRSSRR